MDGSVPYSTAFNQYRPKVEPAELTLKIPCKGEKKDVMTIMIKNRGPDRLVYKMTPSKPHKFNIDKSLFVNFVPPIDAKKIEIYPKKLANSNDFCRFDDFAFEIAPAPEGNLWDANVVFKAAKQISRQVVKLKTEVTKKKDDDDDDDE